MSEASGDDSADGRAAGTVSTVNATSPDCGVESTTLTILEGDTAGNLVLPGRWSIPALSSPHLSFETRCKETPSFAGKKFALELGTTS